MQNAENIHFSPETGTVKGGRGEWKLKERFFDDSGYRMRHKINHSRRQRNKSETVCL